jgi:endonuclease YncB( thermonuclease family)
MRNHYSAIFLLVASTTWAQAQQENDYPPDPLIEMSPLAASPASREGLVNFVLNGQVSAIEDGDTITLQGVRNRFRIRFSDMDTPEIAHDPYMPGDCKCNPLPYRPGQPGGRAARDSLLEMLKTGDSVRAECYEMDNYGRAVCHVFNGSTNLNLEQIRRGWGWLATKSEWVRDPASRQSESEARTIKLGAWGLPNQVHPNTWRHQCWREAKECNNPEPKP